MKLIVKVEGWGLVGFFYLLFAAVLVLLQSSGVTAWSGDSTICNAPGNQQYPQLISDGDETGGAIITWQDDRGTDWDIYAQKVDSNGTAQWTTDGVVICAHSGNQQYPQLISDGDETGGAIITWQDYRENNWDIYAQRVDSNGVTQWADNGVAICTASGNQYEPQIASDGSGGAIITWQDYRENNWDIYAQRVDSNGAAQWTTDGVVICAHSGNQQSPQPISDGSGGAIITWQDYHGTDWDIYAQMVDSSGVTQWAGDGVAICTASGDQYEPQLISDGFGGAIITWQDGSSITNADIYAQMVDSSGVTQWADNGVAICTASGNQYEPQIASDGSGGAIITWQDHHGTDWDIYAQRVNSSGVTQWAGDGVAICTASGDQYEPQIASDGLGGAIITWRDDRGTDWDIYAQRIDSSGVTQWASNGVAICNASGSQQSPQLISDGLGGAIITWQDYRGTDWDIYAQRVDSSGILNYPPVIPDPPDDIPDQTITEGGSFDTINLDDYVSDVDNTDAELTWSYSGNTELTVSINEITHVATIGIPSADWNGAETITFTATDPGLLSDSDAATFTVTAVNYAPVVTDIPDQTVAEGGSFNTVNLDDYVSDVDNTDAELTWSYSGNTELTVSINETTHLATITIPSADWNGAETITFTATDPGLLSDSDAATFTVTAVNDAPVVTDIPNQTVAEGDIFATISLDDYVSDVDNSDAEISWSYSGNTELTVSIDETTHLATITIPDADWNGQETITFTATDPGLLSDSDAATFTVTAVNYAPVVTDIPDQTVAEGGSFAAIALDDYVTDIDNNDAEISWSYSGNTELSVSIDGGTHVATITIPDADWNGAETITFTATDPGLLSDSDDADFEVTAVKDAPRALNDDYGVNWNLMLNVPAPGILSNDTDADDDQLTAFQTSPVKHGILDLNDDGSFIYTPFANYYGTDSFTYQTYDGIFYSNTATVNIEVVLTSIDWCDPSSARPGTKLIVTIVGTNLAGATGLDFGAGVSVDSFTVDSATQITASVTFAHDAASGPRNVTVTIPGGTFTQENVFTVDKASSGGVPLWIPLLLFAVGVIVVVVISFLLGWQRASRGRIH